MQRRNMNNGFIKMKYKIVSKSQNRRKTNSKVKMNQKEKNQINLLMKNKKCNFNMNNICLAKPRTLQEKMDFILSKNIIALTQKLRKSKSPKLKTSRPSLISNLVINSQTKNFDSLRKNNFLNKNNNNTINRNSSKNSKSKKKSPSPIQFNLLNNNAGNILYNLYNTNTNPNSNNKKSILYNNSNNFINNYINDNILLINNNDNTNKKIIRKKSENLQAPK